MQKRLIWIVLCLLVVTFRPDLNGSARTVPAAPIKNAYDLIDAVNALRAKHGLSPYGANSILMGTAQSQANYMAATGNITHYSADGSRPFQRALAAGYSVAGDLSLGGWFSENIMGGPDLSPQDAVNAWTGDTPHLNTMLSPNLYDIGAGVAIDGSFYYYVIDCGASTGAKISYTPSTPSTGGGTVVVVSGTPLTATQDQTIAMAIVSTPDEKGNVYHEVQQGQTLWQIALAYKTTIEQIKQFNGLSSNDIYVGQKLLIARGAGTATPIPPTETATGDSSTSTPLPTVAFFTATLTPVDTPVLIAPVSGDPSMAAGAVVAIVVVALLSAAFIAWFGRSRSI